LEFLVYDGNKTFVEDTNKKEDGVVMCVDVPETGDAEVTVRIKQPNNKCITYYQKGKFTGLQKDGKGRDIPGPSSYKVDPDYSDKIEVCNHTTGSAIKECFKEGTPEAQAAECVAKHYPRSYSDVNVTYDSKYKTHAISSANCGERASNPTDSSGQHFHIFDKNSQDAAVVTQIKLGKELPVIIPQPTSFHTFDYRGKAKHTVETISILPVIPKSCTNLQRANPRSKTVGYASRGQKSFQDRGHDQYKVFTLKNRDKKPVAVDQDWPKGRAGEVYEWADLAEAHTQKVKNAVGTMEDRYTLPVGKTTFVVRVLAGGCKKRNNTLPPHNKSLGGAAIHVGNATAPCLDKDGYCSQDCAVYRDYTVTVTKPGWTLGIILITLIVIAGTTAAGVVVFWGYVRCIQRQYRPRRKKRDPMMEGYDFYDEGDFDMNDSSDEEEENEASDLLGEDSDDDNYGVEDETLGLGKSSGAGAGAGTTARRGYEPRYARTAAAAKPAPRAERAPRAARTTARRNAPPVEDDGDAECV